MRVSPQCKDVGSAGYWVAGCALSLRSSHLFYTVYSATMEKITRRNTHLVMSGHNRATAASVREAGGILRADFERAFE